MIPVTKPFLPSKNEYDDFVTKIWNKNWLTNNGPLLIDLERAIKKYLDIENFALVSNGTIALQIALKVLNITKEVLTTPFSYVASTSSIVWEGCTPVFVDIDPNTLNIDYNKIEAAITEDTEAILATHTFGNPCDIEKINLLAEKYQLKVIYDGAHAFGSFYKGRPLLNYGDITTVSFHATKIFHTVEGGAVITKDKRLIDKVKFMRNFGHDGPEKFNGLGINAKMSEFHAAMGLCNLNHINSILFRRKEQHDLYYKLLKDSNLRFQLVLKGSKYNYSYFPIILPNEKTTLEVLKNLEKENVYPRRYFFPTLNNLDYLSSQQVKIADNISRSILCLPLYHTLGRNDQEFIVKIIKRLL